MAKATIRTAVDNISPTPTQQMTSNGMEYETDALGRRIGVVKPSALDRYRVLKMLGPENSSNQNVVGYAMLACCVREIAGDPVAMPNSERHIEALIARLGDEGFNAIGTCLREKFSVAPIEDEGDAV